MASSLSLTDYFAVALPKMLRQKGTVATGVGANIRFIVTGRGGGVWTVRLRPPSACVVVGAEWKADLLIRVTQAQMMKMLNGTFDARSALIAQEIELSGNLTLLKSLGFLLAPNPRERAVEQDAKQIG